ncbi:polycystin family receptor for egg jelly-like [Oculina patagonica]
MQQVILLFWGILATSQGIQDPVGYYPLNASTGAKDSSSFGNPGGIIFNANSASGVYGETDGSYAFTGARTPPSYIYLNGSGPLDTRYSITLLAWVYPERAGGEIISYWKDSNYGVGLSLDNSRPLFDVYSRDQSTKHSLLGKDNLQLNQWHHIAAAYDNNTGHARLFVDGVQVGNKTMTGIFELETESGLWLGYLFKGKIADVWIFNVSLSVDEVNDVKDFNKPSPLSSPRPLSTSVTSANPSAPTSSNTDEFTQIATTATTATATDALPNPSLHPTATRLSNQTPTYNTPTVNQTLVYPTPTVNKTGLLSTSQTTPLNVSATSTQNMSTTSLINTLSINPSRATDSQSLLGSSVSQAKLLKCYECLGSCENCSNDEVSASSCKQTVCGSDEDRCFWEYTRFNKTQEKFGMNCTNRDGCKKAVESCHELMKTNKLACCDVKCCDVDYCNTPKYSDGKSCQRKPDLVAVIYGGAEVIRGHNETITMNASLSYDPDVGRGDHSGMNFTWHYGEIKGNYSGLQTTMKDSFTGINHSSIRYSGNDSGIVITFNTSHMLVNKTYVVKLVVTKDYRSSSVYQVIHLVKGDPPEISQRCVLNCELKISTSAKLSRQLECKGPKCTKISSYEWILYKQHPSNASAPNADIIWHKKDLQNITSTPLDSSSIVIKKGSLDGGKNYRLALFVRTSDKQSGMSVCDFSTASPPTGGTCSITPSSGISLKTKFSLTCRNWTSDSTPLSYQLQYQLGNGLYSMLYRGLNSTVISWLPPGKMSDNYTVILTVSDPYGASAPAVNLPVQVEPSPFLGPENITNFLKANNSMFNDAIKNGDLSKAAQIANAVLQAVLQDGTMDSKEKAKIQDIIIKNIVSLPVKSLPDLLQSSSVIGSALQETETVSSTSLNSSLSAVNKMTSFLWNSSQSKDVANIPLVTQSAENLGSCLNSVLKAGASIASGDKGSGLQEQGKNLVRTSMEIISLIGDAVLAGRLPDEGMISIETKELTMTLGRHSPDKLAGLKIEGGDGRFVLPADKNALGSEIDKSGFVDTQMLSIPFNPYAWDKTKQRVNSDVLTLDLKDKTRKLIKVANLSDSVNIVMPLKPQKLSLESPKYFTNNDNLRFHEIDVEYKDTLIMLEITPNKAGINLFVYMRYGQRSTTREYDLNATISNNGWCVWTRSAHGKKDGKTECSSNQLLPIKTFVERPGKYFLGVQSSNRSVINSRKRIKRSCLGKRREKRSCVEVKDPPPTPPQSKNVTVVPVYDPETDQNYTLTVALGSCVYWSGERQMWITDGCQVLSATLNGSINCSCNHLTSFGGGILIKPNPIDFDKVLVEFKNLGESGNVAVIVTVAVVFLCYILVLVIVRKADKEDTSNNGLPVRLPATSNNSHEYEITITTGVWRNSGTTAKVAMEIYGTDKSSGIIQLSSEESGVDKFLFSRGNTDVFVIRVDNPLGAIQGVRIGHDNSGESPSWFLEEIVVVDKQEKQSSTFTVSQWLALEREDGRIERIIERAPNQVVFSHEVVKRWWKGLTETHIWVSVVSKPRKSRFTRVQRASCCLSVLLTAMLANAMFYELDGKSEQVIQIGPLKFSWRQVVIGIESALIVAPVNIFITFLFQKGAEKSSSETLCCSKAKWLTYLAWFLFVCSCAVSAAFSIFYSLMWGKSISEQWLSSMFISFTQDVTITEPVKVFFTALLLAAILKRRKNTQEGDDVLGVAKASSSKRRLWTMKLSEVEEMRKRQARKQNVSRFFVELFFYVIFVFLLMVVCYGSRNDHRYLMTKSIQDGLPRFDKVLNSTKYWSWLNDVFVPGVFAGRWYNGQEENQTVYIGNKCSVLVGMARARQLRVKPTSCDVLDFMKVMFPVCYDGYSISNEEKIAYSKPGWKPADNFTSRDELLRLCPKPWRYQNAGESDTVPKWGQFALYPGGGFVADLGYENSTAFSIIKSLENNDWLDRKSRAVILEFATFNPSVNILGIGTYFYEVEASGYRAPLTRTEVISLYSTETASQQFYSICVFLFIVFVVLYFGRECYKLYKQRSRYFKSFWNWVEIFQVVFSVLAVVMYIVQTDRITSVIRKLQENVYANVSFQETVAWFDAENAVLGILTFIVTVKLLRLIRFNEHIAVFSKTLKTSARLLSSFAVVLLTFFVAFLHFGILIFGNGTERYSTVLRGIYFQLELTLGRVKARPINDLAEANDTFGRVFAALLLTSLTIVSMNFFIAIMNDALLEAKSAVHESELYDLIDECDWKSSSESKILFDAISNGIQHSKVKETFVQSKEKEAKNPELNSKNGKAVNFDLISQAIKASKEQMIQGSDNDKPSNTRRKSFFDKVSNIIGYLKHANYEDQNNNKNEKKVRFKDDVIKTQLRRLQKTKQDLFQRLDNILQGYSEEEENFHLLRHKMKAYVSTDPSLGTVNESFA